MLHLYLQKRRKDLIVDFQLWWVVTYITLLGYCHSVWMDFANYRHMNKPLHRFKNTCKSKQWVTGWRMENSGIFKTMKKTMMKLYDKLTTESWSQNSQRMIGLQLRLLWCPNMTNMRFLNKNFPFMFLPSLQTLHKVMIQCLKMIPKMSHSYQEHPHCQPRHPRQEFELIVRKNRYSLYICQVTVCI